jgi:hypothetical protein
MADPFSPTSPHIPWADVAASVVAMRRRMDSVEAEVVAVALASGASWSAIGRALNVATQTVQRRYAEPS